VLADIMLAQLGSSVKYFASVAKILHCWREHARVIFAIWKLKHGAASSLKHARAVPPKCCAGRWGSIAESEAG
jgi:hypothetical protein